MVSYSVSAEYCYRDGDLDGHKRGQYAAAIMKRGIQGQGWKLVVTGHSLGAGVAALLSLKLRNSFPGAGHAVVLVNTRTSRGASHRPETEATGHMPAH